jgi:putative PIN family toxin of toxin-antitoxin system
VNVGLLRAVFDTNVLVSALIKRGKPRELWNTVLDGKIRLTISSEMLTELDEVIASACSGRLLASSSIVDYLLPEKP